MTRIDSVKVTVFLGLLLSLGNTNAASPIRALLITGQNNPPHEWKVTAPFLKKTLEETGLFAVDLSVTPPAGASFADFKPKFSDYRVVILNYNGDLWPDAVRIDFEKYVRMGGGFVTYHSANNAFPAWKEYNEMTGLGGWYGRDEKSGPYLYYSAEGKIVRDESPGIGGYHGFQIPFAVDVRLPDHPITAGLPQRWMHATDELYDRLRGPAKNVTILATAFSDPTAPSPEAWKKHPPEILRPSARHEPMLMTIRYGQGRVFHTVLGHGIEAIRCVGFITTFQRGAEWAATGKVSIPVPKDFPTAENVRLRAASR